MIKLTVGNNGRPAYLQLYEQISAQIIKGDILPDECLPSIRGIASELKISVITVKTAYDMLEKTGYIYTLPGKGCFVADIDGDKEKIKAAERRLSEVAPFFRKLGVSKEELIELIKRLY